MLNLIRHAVSKLRAAVRQTRLRIRIPSSFWRQVINARALPFDELQYQHDGSILLLRAGLRLPADPVARSILRSYTLLIELLEKTDATAAWDADIGELIVRFDEEIYPANCQEEVFTLHELFVQGEYNLYISCNAVLMDIGANVGYTSIFLAAQNPEVNIFSYEPIEVSYSRAKRNLTLNPHLSHRIALNNYGLAGFTGERTIQSEIEHRTRSSMVIDREEKPYSRVEKFSVKVQKVSNVVAAILENNSGKVIWMKMDCEGCEYDILECLAEAGLLSEITGALFEWHTVNTVNQDTVRIHDVLTSHGFSVYMQQGKNTSAEIGLCLAVRS